jgi:competence protein ComEC
VIGPLANSVAIPVVSYIVTPFAMLASLIALVSDWPGLFQAAAWVYTALYSFLNWCAALPWALLDWPSPGVVRATVASLGVAIALSSATGRWLGRWRHAGWLSLGLLWAPIADPPPKHGQMAVTFIDVGQGSSVLIQTHSHAMLVDTGPMLGSSDAGARVVLPVLRRHGIRRLDQLMISHFDQDHSGGLESILSAMPVGTLVSPEDQSTVWARTPESILAARNRPMTFSQCQAGQRWEWDGVKFWVLFPAQGAQDQPISDRDRNGRSCVLHVAAANGASVLLAGDLPAKAERALIAQFVTPSDSADRGLLHLDGASLPAQVLLAPHHGSKTSSSQALLDAVKPAWVVVQAGFRNRFGHPHAQVLERLTVPVLRTDLQGAIAFRWAELGSQPQISDFWAAHRRYWHIARIPEE